MNRNNLILIFWAVLIYRVIVGSLLEAASPVIMSIGRQNGAPLSRSPELPRDLHGTD
jgi:hypothetical protein